MTWHLKDRELEEKLIAIDPEFLKSLNDAVEDFLCDFSYLDTNKTISFMFRTAGLVELGELYFSLSDLEEIPEYNPNAWNDYPKVKPPEGVIMRVESVYGDINYRECGIFDNGFWKNERDGNPGHFILGEVKRFRPWEN